MPARVRITICTNVVIKIKKLQHEKSTESEHVNSVSETMKQKDGCSVHEEITKWPISQIHQKKFHASSPVQHLQAEDSNSVIKEFDLTALHYRSHDLNMWERNLQPQSLNLSSPRCAQPKFLKEPKRMVTKQKFPSQHQ
jgi:hypothetical protein